jgi:hypothetical protein
MSISSLIPASSAAVLGVFSDPNQGISRRGSRLGADALTSTDERRVKGQSGTSSDFL